MANKNARQSPFILLLASVLFLVVLYTMEKVGVPRRFGIGLSAIFAIALWAAAALAGGTTRASQFLSAKRQTTLIGLVLFISASLVFPFLLMDSAMLVVSSPGYFAALIGCVVCGLGLSCLLFARWINLKGASDFSELLFLRYGSSFPGRVIAAPILVGLALLAMAGINSLLYLMVWFFQISHQSAMVAGFLAVGMCVIMGGLFSVSRVAAISAFIFVLALNLNLALYAISTTGMPLGYVTFASDILPAMWDLEDQLRSLQVATLESVFTMRSTIADWPSSVTILAGVLMICALIAYPPIIQAFGSASSRVQSGRAGSIAILVVAFIYLTIFAMLIFASYVLYQTMLGLSVREAAIVNPSLYAWGNHEPALIGICGAIPTTGRELHLACEQTNNQIISTNLLTIEGSLFWIASTDLSGFPLALTAFLAVGSILIVISFCASLILSASSTLVGAFYAHTPKATGSRQIFWNRLVAALLTLGAFFIAELDGFNPTTASLLGLSFLASATLPAAITARYLSPIHALALVSSLAAGFAVTSVLFVLISVGVDLIPGSGDEVRVGFLGLTAPIPAALSGAFGLLTAVLILAIGWALEFFKPSARSII